MTKVDIYNEDYTKLNHAYIQIFESYKKLLDADDADQEIVNILGQILMVLNPTLDKIKSEMTVKTRFKDSSASNAGAKSTNVETETNSKGGKIFHPKFN